MKFSYYPGCTLRNKAKELDAYARASALALGFELEELQDWQCCGGVYPLGTDEIASKLSSVRALAQARDKGQDLVTLCSACHHVLKRVNDDMQNVEDIRTRANNYMTSCPSGCGSSLPSTVGPHRSLPAPPASSIT